MKARTAPAFDPRRAGGDKSPNGGIAPPLVHEAIRTHGRPLDHDVRAFMESGFAHDFSNVRVHTDSPSAESAEAVNARAYTVGSDIVFGHSQYAPLTNPGRRLLAHELAHTLQQGRDSASELTVGPPDSSLEVEADKSAAGVFHQAQSARPKLTQIRAMVQRDDVPLDLEVPTPQEQERLNKLGVRLPSAHAVDPRTHSDFVDRRMTAVGFGIYLFGYHLYVEGLALPVFLPESEVNFTLSNAAPINSSIYPDRDSALADIPFGPPAPGQPYPFAYYRGVGGLVVPTVFSLVTAPRTVQTMLAARRQLAQEVTEALTVLALSLVGGMVLRGMYSRIVRGSEAGPAPGRGTLAKSPAALGEEIGMEIKALPTGKRAGIAARVTQANLPQADAATATGEASRVAFGRIGGTVTLPNGDKIVPSVAVGSNQPVFIVKPNGQVIIGRATISVAQPPNVANPLRITDVTPE
jgi:hypothetical protein